MAAQPRLSVILVTDRYETVRKMVESLAAQSRRDEVELVFVTPAAAGVSRVVSSMPPARRSSPSCG